jgi:hypothetical protein
LEAVKGAKEGAAGAGPVVIDQRPRCLVVSTLLPDWEPPLGKVVVRCRDLARLVVAVTGHRRLRPSKAQHAKGWQRAPEGRRVEGLGLVQWLVAAAERLPKARGKGAALVV